MADGAQIRQIAVTQLQSVRFCSNFAYSVVTWQPIHNNHSRSKDQRSRSQCKV